ncbi:hypothetical protein, partial [Helicobacter sp. MIT 01-3238]|uniref:hypothetical protein n=1 Tax=Helicobacter sp. MIT 01-3238 TaxID=398627 RepID=UPI000E3B0D77
KRNISMRICHIVSFCKKRNIQKSTSCKFTFFFFFEILRFVPNLKYDKKTQNTTNHIKNPKIHYKSSHKDFKAYSAQNIRKISTKSTSTTFSNISKFLQFYKSSQNPLALPHISILFFFFFVVSGFGQ